MDKFTELKEIVDSLMPDIEKFYKKGNKSAGVRIRKSMQEIKVIAQDIRLHVQETKNML